MIALLQRVTHARVVVDAETVGSIGPGLLVLVGVEPGDTADTAGRLLARVCAFRVFADAQGRMSRSLAETAGGLLLVPQFTLAADTTSGTRPGFSTAAAPAVAQPLFEALATLAHERHGPRGVVATGRFGAHMQVSLTNDGPVTFSLRVPPPAGTGTPSGS